MCAIPINYALLFKHFLVSDDRHPHVNPSLTPFKSQDESHWRSLSPDVIQSALLSGSGSPVGKSSWGLASRNPPLVGPNLDSSILASDLEQELKILIAGKCKFYAFAPVPALVSYPCFHLCLYLLFSFHKEHRRNMSLITNWDEDLGQVLHPALTAYELDRILGAGNTAELNQDFQHAIRHYVPEGHTFKGKHYFCVTTL